MPFEKGKRNMLLYLSGHGEARDEAGSEAAGRRKKDLTKRKKCSNINDCDARAPRKLNQCYA